MWIVSLIERSIYFHYNAFCKQEKEILENTKIWVQPESKLIYFSREIMPFWQELMHTFQSIKPNPQQEIDDTSSTWSINEDQDIIVRLHTELKEQVQ